MGSVQDTCKKWSQGWLEGERLRLQWAGQVVHIQHVLPEAADVLARVRTDAGDQAGGVNAGEKVHRRAAVKMHHGACSQGHVERHVSI
jgi:hypothetical protein